MVQMLRILGKRGRITIPYEIRQRVGFKYNDVLSFTETTDGHFGGLLSVKSFVIIASKISLRQSLMRLRSLIF